MAVMSDRKPLTLEEILELIEKADSMVPDNAIDMEWGVMTPERLLMFGVFAALIEAHHGIRKHIPGAGE